MGQRLRRIFTLAIFVAAPLLTQMTQGQSSEPEAARPSWSKLVNLRGGLGYKDNVLLSDVQPVGSPFWLSEAEIFVLGRPLDSTKVSFFASGTDARYFSAGPVEKEQTLLAQGEVKQALGTSAEAGLALQYVYMDQIFDTSTTETNGVTQVLGHTLTVRPSVRQDLPGNFWVEARGKISRQYFAAPLDDYWEMGPRLLLGKQYGNRSEVSLAYEIRERTYDTRNQFTAAGSAIPDTSLSYVQQEGELVLDHYWDSKRRIRSTSKLGLELNDSGGEGYFDYLRYRAAEKIGWQGATWDLQAQASLNYYHYPIQTASSGAFRRKTRVTLTLRGEKQLSEHFKIFAEYEHERSISNETFDEYAVNTAVAGVDLEF